ncbi:hypothetical protein ND861_02230 [Leptospira sp. 2 VSF19]|uniref:Uncharacterized protein n=1 Tax=Leptospira soteropolitanensis TaxID=2950025 RepID=A0AAW5VFR0_9LEPT|nr:hypothetical protein [Leptospira soteropolitanensis]MCW7491465.1 hypothetical protein [Leptospira soteropolitanensis]MCW7499049.1 hypothetical protein [Leptospira soteropolitanensis]MCW7521359.1 hypothetical protein [Leptospira soteropolitanensis]MCW7525153.1 hypothetical protein [Leptospira soteropolitanensis]MCW7529020.1 hypothetical protein [Leptospira soteropolitanensis]
MNPKIKITIQFIFSHLSAYLLVSIPYFQLVMKDYYEGQNAVFPLFLITANDGAAWSRAMTWLFPALLIQAILIVCFLIVIWDWFRLQTFGKQMFVLVWMRTVLGGLASISPAVGSLEGMVFLIPEISLSIHLYVVFEIFLQSLVQAGIFLTLVNRGKQTT